MQGLHPEVSAVLCVLAVQVAEDQLCGQRLRRTRWRFQTHTQVVCLVVLACLGAAPSAHSRLSASVFGSRTEPGLVLSC